MIGAHLGTDPTAPGTDVIPKAAACHDLPVNFQCSGNLDAPTRLIDRHPQTRFVIDHLGIRQPRSWPVTTDSWADLPKLLELARRPNAVVKVSGACTLSRAPYPHDDLWQPLQRVFDAWSGTLPLGHGLDAHLSALSVPQRRRSLPAHAAPERRREGAADGRDMCQGVRLATGQPLAATPSEGAGNLTPDEAAGGFPAARSRSPGSPRNGQ
jgi:hypothetical protein